jgi:hypothetical protein
MEDDLPPRLETAVWISRCALRLLELDPLLDALKSREIAERLAETTFANFAQPGYAAVDPEEFAEAYLASRHN